MEIWRRYSRCKISLCTWGASARLLYDAPNRFSKFVLIRVRQVCRIDHKKSCIEKEHPFINHARCCCIPCVLSLHNIVEHS